MTKHNKKRNVGLIYELLLKHLSVCLIEGRMRDLKKTTAILERRFAKGTELYKEFRLFNALAQTTASDTHVVVSILTEAKRAARNYNREKLDREKTRLIQDINYKIKDKSFYYRNISNYRDLASIQILINEWRNEKSQNIQKLIEFEKKVGELLLTNKKVNTIDEENERLNASHSNSLVVKIMTEKINNKYGDNLSSSEKEIIRNYAIYGDTNLDYLKEFLNSKKNEAYKLLENFEDVEDNKILIEKVDRVRERIKSLDTDTINDNSIVKFLTVTKLVTELKSNGEQLWAILRF